MLPTPKTAASSFQTKPCGFHAIRKAAQQTVFVRISPAEMRDLGKKLIALADELGGE